MKSNLIQQLIQQLIATGIDTVIATQIADVIINSLNKDIAPQFKDDAILARLIDVKKAIQNTLKNN